MGQDYLAKYVRKSCLVPQNGSFVLSEAPTEPPEQMHDGKLCRRELEDCIDELKELQERLYADSRYAVLIVFQAMDAAGKDSTIRAVMSGVNPAGCEVHSFKAPSTEELDHDFLWRVYQRLPGKGKIGIFNRSHYEEVLVVRVHPELLEKQKLPNKGALARVWDDRLESIRSFEHHLARNGTLIIKFWLNVSPAEQRKRFLARIEEPQKNWKFEAGDIEERRHWKQYMHAYQEALGATARPWAPWYAIPADFKPFMRLAVARIVVDRIKTLPLVYPKPPARARAELRKMKALLIGKSQQRP